MKVTVRCAHNNGVTKSEMEQIIESLFQENKDLRVYCGHLRDELNLAQQQSEARRQVICERDKTIQELEEKIADSSDYGDEGIDHWMQKYEELKAQKEAEDKKSEEICAACNERYEDVLADRNRLRERVAKYEKSVTFAKMEEATLTISRLREEVEILVNERDTAVDENTQLTFELAELKDKYEAERALRWNAENQVQYWRNEAQQKESNLRAAIEEREHWSDKAAQLSDEVQFYKSGRDATKKELEELDKEVERLRGVEETVETYRMARDVERQRRIEAEENYQSIYEEYERMRDAADEYRKRCQELTKIKEDRFDSIAQLIMKAVAADDTASKVLRFSEEIK